MTGYVIHLDRNRLCVASDTLAYIGSDSRPISFITKIFPLPNLRAVVFSRGQHQLVVQAVGALHLGYDIQSIEDAAEELPATLRHFSEIYAEDHELGDHRNFLMFGLYLAGWSERDRRMKLWYFENTRDYVPEERVDLPWVNTAPELPAALVPPDVARLPWDKRSVACLKALRRYFAETPDCGTSIGGEVDSWDLTPTGMTRRILHRFEDYEITRNAAAAGLARVLRGDFEPLAESLATIDQVRGPQDYDGPTRSDTEAVNRAERRRQEKAAKRLARRVA
jgi:hypothetical protein